MLITIFLHFASTQVARFSSLRTLSTLTSVSNLSTFMTQDEACKIKSLKENRDGHYKVFFHRASFRRAAAIGQKYFTVLSLHISNILAKKKGFAQKLILTLRAIMISQEVDLVACDFNGTAWRCRSRDNLSPTIVQSQSHHCGDPDPPRTTGQTCVDSSNHLALNVSGK